MDKTNHDIAIGYLKSIEHIDEILSFILNELDSGNRIALQAAGSIEATKSFTLEGSDYNTLIEAFENAKKELEAAFATRYGQRMLMFGCPHCGAKIDGGKNETD